MSFMEIASGHEVVLPGRGSRPRQVHVFDTESIDAINASLAAQRPLLVRGEPGIGKSQLARAAAKQLGRVFISLVVNARTEAADLLWHFDAVARLADAQLAGALGTEGKQLRKRLSVRHYLHPGPLWWAFDWNDACAQAELVNRAPPFQDRDPQAPRQPDPARGSVVLIDEIDKAEPDVPNGLLEALGSGELTPPGRSGPVVSKAGVPPPLVIISTNNERRLSDAFTRRCLVLHLRIPEDTPTVLRDFLVDRGVHHFPHADPDVLAEAARQLGDDRCRAREDGQSPLPGQAEYLDLVRAVITLAKKPSDQRTLITKLAGYTYRKHPDARR